LPAVPTQGDLEAHGLTPLQHAEARGHRDIAALLRTASVPTGNGTAPNDIAAANRRLLEAAEAGDADAATLALRSGADLETRDARRRTPLLLAAAGDRHAVARVLVALGADPNASTTGMTPRGS
jgi:ankyrin repeat protein